MQQQHTDTINMDKVIKVLITQEPDALTPLLVNTSVINNLKKYISESHPAHDSAMLAVTLWQAAVEIIDDNEALTLWTQKQIEGADSSNNKAMAAATFTIFGGQTPEWAMAQVETGIGDMAMAAAILYENVLVSLAWTKDIIEYYTGDASMAAVSLYLMNNVNSLDDADINLAWVVDILAAEIGDIKGALELLYDSVKDIMLDYHVTSLLPHDVEEWVLDYLDELFIKFGIGYDDANDPYNIMEFESDDYANEYPLATTDTGSLKYRSNRQKAYTSSNTGKKQYKAYKVYKAPADPKLRFTPYAWAKLLYWQKQACGRELSAFGISHVDNFLVVSDVICITQTREYAHTEFDDDAISKYFETMVDKGLKPEQFARIWIHTHPEGVTSASQTDEQTFQETFGNYNWAVMFILEATGKTYCRLQFNVGPKAALFLPVEVAWEYGFGELYNKQWQQEFVETEQTVKPGRSYAALDWDVDYKLWAKKEQQLSNTLIKNDDYMCLPDYSDEDLWRDELAYDPLISAAAVDFDSFFHS